MIAANIGAAIIGPKVDPIATKLLGKPRSLGAYHPWICCKVIGLLALLQPLK